MMIMPPQVSMEYYEVRVYFFKAEDLPKMDEAIIGKAKTDCNAYIKLKYMNYELKTSIKDMKNGLVVWNERISVLI